LTFTVQQNLTDPDALRKEVLTVGKHSMVYLIGRALSHAVGFFMIPIYTRCIAPANYGAMELIEILAGAIAMIICMEVADVMSLFYFDERVQEKQNEVVSTVIIGFGLIAVPIVLLFLVLSGLISRLILEEPQFRYYIQVAIVTVWFGMLCEIGYTYLRILYKAKLFVTITILQLVIALSLNIYFVVFLRLDILGIFYSTLITQGLTGLVLSGAILRSVGTTVSLPVLRKLIRFGLPLVPSRIGVMLGFMSNRFFLRWCASSDPSVALAQVGLFSLGHKFGVMINRLYNVPFNSFWGPRRLELSLQDNPGNRETVARICTYSTMCSIYLALMLSSGIESLIKIIADPRYMGAYMVVPFVALGYVALGLETHFSTGILCRRKTIWSTYIGLLSLCVILLWNYIFISRYGLLGAATSNLAGFTIRIILIYIISQRLFPIPFELGRLTTLFVTAFALYCISQTIRFSSVYLTFFVQIGFVSLFPFVLLVIKFYRSGELEFMRKVFSKFKFFERLHATIKNSII